MMGENLRGRAARKEWFARQRVVRGYAQRIDVASAVDRLAHRLFRTHEFGCPQHLGMFVRFDLGYLRDAEIHDEGASSCFFQQDVVWLDVTVHDTLCVSVGQCPGDFP